MEDIRSYNVGKSDYSKRRIQPWDIWEEYQLNPWDADIIKRVLRTKEGDSRKMDYEKIIHVCKKCIEMLDNGTYYQAPPYKGIPVEIVLKEGGVLPKKSTDGAAAYDIVNPHHVIIKPGRNVIPLGFRIALPYGIGDSVNSRSGFAAKGMEGYFCWTMSVDGITPDGNPRRMDADVRWGLIDSDYRGECGAIIHSHEEIPFLLAAGTRCGQMCFQRYEDVDFKVVESLDETERGEGGFGHTGTRG